jgi:hypothetical protein
VIFKAALTVAAALASSRETRRKTVKPRSLGTKKILIGIAVATASSTSLAGPPVRSAAPSALPAARPVVDADGYPLVGNLIRKGGGGRRPPPPDADVSPALLALRDELDKQTPAKALAQLKRFRPLCDKDGYPLVGNLVRKDSSGYQPSEFCAAVRKAQSGS